LAESCVLLENRCTNKVITIIFVLSYYIKDIDSIFPSICTRRSTHLTSMSCPYFFVLTTFWRHLYIYKSTDAHKNGIYFSDATTLCLLVCLFVYSFVCWLVIFFNYFFLFSIQELQVPLPSSNKCRCGKISKSKNETDRMYCDPTNGRCPCVLDNLPCVYCQCYNCLNKPPPGTPLSCKCNTSKKRGANDACLNKDRSNCCCARAGLPCTSNCFCYNCGNGKPVEEQEEQKSEGETPCKRPRKGFKNKQALVKKESDEPAQPKGWTEQEIICLMVCREVLAACNIEQNLHNIGQVFSYIAKSKNNANLGLSISERNDQEIQEKLLFLHYEIPVVTELVALNANTLVSSEDM